MDYRRFGVMVASIGAAVIVRTTPCKAEADAWFAYQAPPVCASRAEFLTAVGARGVSVAGPAAARTMEISIRQADDGFVGSFRIRERDAVSGERELRAAACNDVTNGLAIVTAIALGADPSAPPPAAPLSTPPARAAPAPVQEYWLQKNADVFTANIEVPAGTLRFQSLLTTTLTGGVVVGQIPSLVLPRYDLTLFRANFATTPNALTYLVGPVCRCASVTWARGRFGRATVTRRGPTASGSGRADVARRSTIRAASRW